MHGGLSHFIIGASTALMLCACSNQVNLERYSLTTDCQAAAAAHPFAVTLQLSPPLNDGGIIMRTGDYTLVSAQSHRWAVPLQTQLLTLFNQALLNFSAQHTELSNALQKAHYTLTVTAFQGTPAGQAEVAVLFTLKDDQANTLLKVESSSKRALRADGYSALCSALEAGFMQISNKFLQEATPYLN